MNLIIDYCFEFGASDFGFKFYFARFVFRIDRSVRLATFRTFLPRYSPQIGQAMWGSLDAPHEGHFELATPGRAKCAARSFLERLVRRFDGRPISLKNPNFEIRNPKYKLNKFKFQSVEIWVWQ